MADMKDNLFGTLAVRGHFVLPEQVNEALAIQLQFEQGGQKAPRMGEILAAKGYMTPEQVQAVLRGQGSPQGKMFGQVASAWHFCSEEDVQAALAFQQEQRAIGQRAPRIGEILVSRGAMKPHQIRAVLQAQGKQIVMCPTCGTRYNAVNVSAGAKLKCPRCQVVFVPFSSATRPDEDVRADITVSLPAIKVGETQSNQPPKMDVGGYQLGQKLGMDHSGVLYKALHPQTGNHVALRLLSSQVMQGAEEFDLWVSAGQTATELNHPNLQRILSMGSEGGRAYLVMEYVEGKSLRARVAEAHRLQPLEALEIMIQVGDALAYGHARDLIHGDLRPNHILIGLDGRVRLSGLGTPKQVMKDLRLMAEKSGNIPLYTAPEVLINEASADEQSDIYSLCSIGYHMVTGKPPMDGSDVLQAGMRIASQDVALPRSLDPGIAPYLERLLLKGLSPDQEDRYPSIVALLADLRKCRGGLLIQAQDLPEVASEIRP
ncbi:MAG: protein kinase, partial [Planctomycetota bacterium]|nr:protein kinase [Planctomycetota bacterium]